MSNKIGWPQAFVNIVFVGGVICASILLQCSSCLWALLLTPALWGY